MAVEVVSEAPNAGTGAAFAERLLKYWTNPFSTCTFPGFFGRATTTSAVFEVRKYLVVREDVKERGEIMHAGPRSCKRGEIGAGEHSSGA